MPRMEPTARENIYENARARAKYTQRRACVRGTAGRDIESTKNIYDARHTIWKRNEYSMVSYDEGKDLYAKGQ